MEIIYDFPCSETFRSYEAFLNGEFILPDSPSAYSREMAEIMAAIRHNSNLENPYIIPMLVLGGRK